MKKKNVFVGLFLTCLYSSLLLAQKTGDLAFIAFNTDGDRDFSVVALADIASNSTIYFTDDESNGTGGFVGSEGVLTWLTGPSIIKAGTVIVFSDTDKNSNPNFGASIGTISRSGSFTLSGSKDGLIAYTGTDTTTPTTFIAAIQLGNKSAELGPFDADGVTLTNTGLMIGTTIIVIDNVASPDGGKYSGSRSNQTSYADYLPQLANVTANWTTVASNGNGEALLPYSQKAFTINTTNWTGASSTNWNLSENWDNGIPSSSSLVKIPNTVTTPIISSGTTANVGNLIIDKTVIINSNNALTIHGNLIVNGSLKSKSGSSLILKGTASGSISYSRTLSTNWHLISSPVESQNINTFTVTNVAENAIKTSGNNYGIAPYNNNGAAWVYYTRETISSSGNFLSGKGYAALRNVAGDITFTGTIPTKDVSIAITDGTTNEWNLIGNPFPSYIPANSSANTTNNFLTMNTSSLDTSFQAIYFWNGASYAPVNHASESRFIAPGQGFFIHSKINGATINFTQTMQSHQTTDVFSKTPSKIPTITLTLSDGKTKKQTQIKYITETTTGLDPGYDAGMFTGAATAFSIYTHLVSNSNGTPFSLQVLPDNNYENIIIPVGLNAKATKTIFITVNHRNLPKGMMVFLEDKKNNSIHRLDKANSRYTIALDKDILGIGRFYLRTSTHDISKTLHSNTTNLQYVKIYLTAKRNLKITGLKNKNFDLKIYNILDKQIINKKLKSKANSIAIKIPDLIKKGIYIVKINSQKGSFTKKILISN